MATRIVSVFGATGQQGGAVVNALLKHGTFVPRAISRDPESEAAKQLRARGVQVVQGDALDKAGLVNALRGSEAVFALTIPVFPPVEGKSKLVQGKNIVDAAKEVGVKFFIWSSLPSISKISGGKYTNVIHYEEKDAVRAYLASSGLSHASILLPAFLENLYSRPLLKKSEAGSGYTITMPIFKPTDTQAWAWIARDVPAAALAFLTNYIDPAKLPLIDRKTFPIVSAAMTCAELVAKVGKVLGAEVTFISAPPTGVLARDEMFASHAEYSGLYTATPVPNPDLVALGMQFSTVEEFLETEVKPRFVQ
ncbi:NAD(P)-binding protein [Mycena galopus ATCC 62051]|nr:NAD(P)-binding protein [Mycena galopus ATCC 62051]